MSPAAEVTLPYQTPENGWRTFIIVWVTQSISVFGSALTFFSLTIWLTQVLYPDPAQKSQLAFALSATGLAWALPIEGAATGRGGRGRRGRSRATRGTGRAPPGSPRRRPRPPAGPRRRCLAQPV